MGKDSKSGRSESGSSIEIEPSRAERVAGMRDITPEASALVNVIKRSGVDNTKGGRRTIGFKDQSVDWRLSLKKKPKKGQSSQSL